MSVESINEPGNSRLVSHTPMSINEPPTFDGLNPPRAIGMEPTGCAIGDPPITLRVTGTDFTNKTLIVFDGVPSVTVYVSPTELSTLVTPAAFIEARGYPVAVGQGAYTSQPAMMFTVTEAARAAPDKFKSLH
jgi:hypothetical protein